MSSLNLAYLTIKGFLLHPFNSTTSVRRFIQLYTPADLCIQNSLDLGCGLSPNNIFHSPYAKGVDIMSSNDSTVKQADLSIEQIPFEDGSFDAITSFDFLEHIPRTIFNPIENKVTLPFIRCMNDIYRVLAPNGIFLSKTPSYPSRLAFHDPTHVNFITDSTLKDYFCISETHKVSRPGASMYGFNGCFKHIKTKWLLGGWTVSMLQKM